MLKHMLYLQEQSCDRALLGKMAPNWTWSAGTREDFDVRPQVLWLVPKILGNDIFRLE